MAIILKSFAKTDSSVQKSRGEKNCTFKKTLGQHKSLKVEINCLLITIKAETHLLAKRNVEDASWPFI